MWYILLECIFIKALLEGDFLFIVFDLHFHNSGGKIMRKVLIVVLLSMVLFTTGLFAVVSGDPIVEGQLPFLSPTGRVPAAKSKASNMAERSN